MDATSEKLFRQYEIQLDEHHKSLALWRMPRGEAIYAVLGYFDAIQLVHYYARTTEDMGPGESQRLKSALEGTQQAFKWLCPHCEQIEVVPTKEMSVIEAAGEFADFGSKYVDIADFHRMFEQGLVTVDVCPHKKSVTFEPAPLKGLDAAMAWLESCNSKNTRGKELIEHLDDSARRELPSALNDIDCQRRDGHIHFDQLPEDLADRLSTCANITLAAEEFPLPPDADLVGFTMADFRAFFSAIVAWSQLAFYKYFFLAMKGIRQEICMPTQIVERSEFVSRMSRLSRLPQATAEEILRRLTFDPKRNPDIMIRPIFATGDCVAWSPAIIMQFRPERNMLKCMARGNKALKHQADLLIGNRETQLLSAIGKLFAKRGYQFKLRTAIEAAGKNGEIDLLLYKTSRANEVLLIEAKALLAPDEVNEVQHVTKEMIHGQEQLRTAQEILNAMTLAQKSALFKFVQWDKVDSTYAVVLSAEGEPNAHLSADCIPAMAFTTLKGRLRRRDLRTPKRFWTACRTRPWLDKSVSGTHCGYHEIPVGDLTYRIPQAALRRAGDRREDSQNA